MASTTEKTFGSRLYDAQRMALDMATFVNYAAPTAETTVVTWNQFIAEVGTTNNLVPVLVSAFSLAVADRQNKFDKNADSMRKILSPIGSYVSARFGKGSKQHQDIMRMINNIRNVKHKKLKDGDEDEFVSQSHQSYGSLIQTFRDIVNTLASYADYTPPAGPIELANLQAKQAALEAANDAVTSAYAVLKPSRVLRTSQYVTLNKRGQTIKDAVKSQFGFKSTEYSMIKGYKI